jgi:phosphoribosylformylglycinamidine (FGAM) synthase-like enzyme
VGDGGLGVALAQAALAEERSSGFRLELVIPPGSVSREAILFSETPSRFVISCRKDYLPRIKGILQQSGVELAGEGSVGGKEFVLSGAVECSVPVSTARRVFLA